jgi:hypothetical protein
VATGTAHIPVLNLLSTVKSLNKLLNEQGWSKLNRQFKSAENYWDKNQ